MEASKVVTFQNDALGTTLQAPKEYEEYMESSSF